ncbi:MAG: hypothetical protein ACREVW_11425 [Burkholderiales bacterium]
MNATGATLVFSVSFAAMGLAGAYGQSIGIALFGLALTLPAGAFAFWFGARRVRHKWYSALISGVLAFAVALATLGALKPVLSLWLLLLAIDVAIAASGFYLGRMPVFPEVAKIHTAPSENPQQENLVYAGVVCILVFGVVPVGFAALSLQRLLLQPADSVLFGPALFGELMVLVPIIVFGVVLSFVAAWPLTNWIRRVLRMRHVAYPVPRAAWEQLIKVNWRLIGGIAGVILITVGAKGFASYFYVTEGGVSVRPPLEFSMRHYEWTDVTIVRVHYRHSLARSKSRFRYILEMSDGYEVDLTLALLRPTAKLRAASAARFAESIPSLLNRVPSIRYGFDVSQDALASLAESHGVVLSNALREQILAHGGTLQ